LIFLEIFLLAILLMLGWQGSFKNTILSHKPALLLSLQGIY
jgi:hypothetical protein